MRGRRRFSVQPRNDDARPYVNGRPSRPDRRSHSPAAPSEAADGPPGRSGRCLDLWSARKPGSGLLTASLGCLARLAGQARSTAIEGIRRLEELGVIQRIRRRVRVAWAGSVASRVIANGYLLLVSDTETGGRSGREQPLRISLVETPSAAVKAAQEALERRRRATEIALLLQQERHRCPRTVQ